jgi:hypothetical protein
MKDKTAVEWLVKELNNLHPDLILSLKMWDDIDNLINQAKQKEKEQIINARIDGDENHTFNSMMREDYANDYYNETYGK